MKMIKFLVAITCLLHNGGSIPLSGCAPDNFRCRDGTCIAKTLFCNGKKDCAKGEDEQRCTVYNRGKFNGKPTSITAKGTASKTNATSCDYSQFECDDGTCISKYWVCDGYRDCPYGEDEQYCSTLITSTDTTTTQEYTTTRYPETTTWPYRTTTPDYTTTRYPETTTWPYRTTTPDYTTTRYPETTTWPYHTTTQYPETTTWPYRTTTPYPTPTTAYPTPCEYPYDSLADRCVFVDPVLHATWDEARYICGRAGGGDLVILDSMDFYSELVQYMKTNGLTRHSYWVGGRGMVYEGKWEWASGSAVRMGTPLWALYRSNPFNSSSLDQYEQEPEDFYKSLENCGYLDFDRFHYMDDDDCNEIKAAICQLPTWKESIPDEPAIAEGEPAQVPATDEKSPHNEPIQPDGVPEESPGGGEPIQDPEALKESSHGKSRILPAPLETSPPLDPDQTGRDSGSSPKTFKGPSHGKSKLLQAALDTSPAGDPDQSALDSGSSGSSPGKEAANWAWCDYPYDLVGGRCVVIDPVLSATWEEARYMCERTGGDLVVLDSMDFYSEIIDYMKENGLDRHDYWIGGIGSISGRRWQWVSGSTVLDGTPLWALSGTDYDGYEQEPTYFEESLSNCGYLDRRRFHFMDDTDCQGLKAAICQLPTWSQGAAIEKGVPEVKKLDAEREKELQEIAKSEHRQI